MGKEHKKETTQDGEDKSQREPASSKELNIGKFLDARASELLKFEEALKGKFKDSTRTPMQTVPKHMRRRTMAHNRFRVPSRIRTLNAKYMRDSEKKVLRCRKHARNSKLILLHYFKRSLGREGLKRDDDVEGMEESNQGLPAFLRFKWLETHIWHARRFEMEEYCGYKIAKKSRQKILKHSRVQAISGCMMYDMSFYCMIEIEGKNVHKTFENFGRTMRGAGKLACELFVDENVEGVIQLKTSDESLMIIAPTIVKSYLEDKLQSFIKEQKLDAKLKDYSDLLNIFELTGPTSLTVLHSALKDLAPSSAPSHPFLHPIPATTSSLPPPLYLTPFLSLLATCQYTAARDITHPLSIFVPTELPKERPGNTVELVGVVNGLGVKELGGFFEGVKRVQAESGLKGYLGRFIEARRAQYSHKRKKLPSLIQTGETPAKPEDPKQVGQNGKMKDELPTPIFGAGPNSSPKKGEQNKIVESSPMDEEKVARDLLHRIREEELKEFKVLVVNISNRHNNSNRLLVITQSGYGKRLWRKLFQKGGRAVGRDEREFAFRQMGKRIFPDDCLHSSFFTDFDRARADKLEKVYYRKPPAKRPNFASLGMDQPFSILPLPHPRADYDRFVLRSLGRGVPHTFGNVYFPLQEDFMTLLKQFTENNRTLDWIMNSSQSKEISYSRGQGEERDVIGRIFYGGLHFETGKGRGVVWALHADFAKLVELTQILKKTSGGKHLKWIGDNEALVLFRNCSSVHYHFGILHKESH